VKNELDNRKSMENAKTCPRCGHPLPGHTVRGLCLKCLALVVFPGDLDKTVVLHRSGPEAPQPALQPTLRYFGDYELLEEIARGGMGVVFKARQVSLNRLVAVKMILSGQLAGEAEVIRFRTEAEAAAHLQHPNIVAIHEIGQHEGHHYFSMDYVEGPNLADVIKDKPLSAAKAAEMLKTIAQAVHYAHQRGTLHRDLKPHNVLVDANGQPRITDFGLAKRMDQDGGLTQTGAVMGSPAYMPPEQAAGRLDQIGPQSDIYSLGAILYQLLTGHPPFAGETPVKTIQQVMEMEPAAPSKLNANVPPDPETICLKCLEKRPERRYHSARELAEELDRFLKHEPILARPASRMRKAWNWAMRNPWFLTGVASTALLGLLGLAFGLWEQNRFLVWNQTHGVSQHHLSNLLGITLAIAAGMVLLGFLAAPLSFADFVGRKRKGLPIGLGLYRAYGSIGVLSVLGSAATVLGLVHVYIWREQPQDPPPVLITLGMCVPGAWFGTLLLWHLACHYQHKTFARESGNEELLFPPQKRTPERVELVAQRQRRNRYCWALLAIFAFNLDPDPMFAGALRSIALAAAAVPVLLAWHQRTRSANRHLLLFAGFLLWFGAVCSVAIVNRLSVIVSMYSMLGLFVAGIGLAIGCLLAGLDSKKRADVVEVADLAWVKALKKRALAKAPFNLWLCAGLVLAEAISVLAAGPLLFASAPAACQPALGFVVCLVILLVYQAACSWRAEGAERRARVNSAAVTLAASLLCLLGNPIKYEVEAVAIGLGAGLLALALLFLLGRSIQNKPRLSQ
jgi:hypothetical protein